MKRPGLSVAQNSAITLGASVAGYALTFAASVIVARVLGPQGKGALQLVVLAHTLALTVANLGFSSANSFFVARGRFSFAVVSRHAGWLAVGLGLLAFALTALASRLLPPSMVAPEQRMYVVLAGALVPFALLTQFFTGALQGAARIVSLNFITFTQSALYALGVTLLLLVCPLELGGALAAFAASTVGTSLLAWVLVGRVARQSARTASPSSTENAGPRWSPAFLREAFHYGSRAYLSNVVSFLNLRSDQFLLGYLAGTAAVGQYSIAVTVAELLLFFPRALSTALLPRITSASREDAGHIAASASRHTLAASLVGLVGIAPLALLIPAVFGEQYRPAVIPCLVIAPGIAAYSLAPVLSTYFSGQLGRPLISSLLAALSLALDLVLVWILVPRFAVVGAALASVIAYGLTVVVMVTLFRRFSATVWREMLTFRRADWQAYAGLISGAWGRFRRRA